MSNQSISNLNDSRFGISCIFLGIFSISVQDMLIKQLSENYALHQIVFFRALIAIIFTIVIIRYEGGFNILKTTEPWLHLSRGLLLVVANMAFFSALAVMPLGEATAVFFVAPLLISLLAVPFLGEQLGIRRLIAAVVGFLGMLLIAIPDRNEQNFSLTELTNFLPLLGAIAYAFMQVLTRRLGVKAKASAMAFYIQIIFIFVSSIFWLPAGDGKYSGYFNNKSVEFLLRAWHYPEGMDILMFLGCGILSTIISYSLAQAYRVTDAVVVSPFEYMALPLAILWGWFVWGEFPDSSAVYGIVLITSSGFYVIWREKFQRRSVSARRFLWRW